MIKMENKLENKIIHFCKNKYKNNLAAVLIYGSYFTGNYKENESDLDLIILLKSIPPKEKDKGELIKKIPSLKLFIHHLKTIKDYKKEIYEKGSWSSWIVLTKGSKIIFSSKEFIDFQKSLINYPINKNKLMKFIIEKDNFDLNIDLPKKSGWPATKMIFAHIRRKLQILYFYKKNQIEPDFGVCLSSLNIHYNEKLKLLNKYYLKRDLISNKEITNYVIISKNLTKTLIKN